MTTRDRERVLELVGNHGWNATAFQTLATGYSYFFHGREAAVAYVDTGQAWVAAGAPICADERLAEASAAFAAAAREAGRRCCFFATEERLRRASGDALRSLCIGEQPVWDPSDWPGILERAGSLREQLRRARAKGVRVRVLDAAELGSAALRERLERVAERWRAPRTLAPMDFLVRVETSTFPAHRRCFVAEREGEIVGFAALIPVPARGGWFLEHLVRDPRAPNGTSESLVDAAMRWAEVEGSHWLTLGLAPLAGEVNGLLRFARRAGRRLYDFEGLAAFKSKLRPRSSAPIYLSYPASQGTLLSLGDALCAFTGGGVLRFGLRSLRRIRGEGRNRARAGGVIGGGDAARPVPSLPQPEFDLAACLRQVAQGDEDAARTLVARCHPLVGRLVRAHRPRSIGADDLEQEVFLKMFTMLPQYELREGKPFEHWLARLAVRTCRDVLRGEARRADHLPLSPGAQDWLGALANEEEPAALDALAARELVERLLEALPPQDRLVLTLLDLEQRSTAEIAALTGWSRALVKVRAFRARLRLRALVRSQRERGDG